MGRKAKEVKMSKITDRSFDIKEAVIKDDFCNYSYEVTEGKATGFTHQVKGKGIIEDDLRNAFAKLNVHLAFIDDVYKHSDVNFPDIDKMHNDELALLYTVTGFKIKGIEENEAIILIGNKHLSAGGRMELESPKIPIDDLSSYKWFKALKSVSNLCREEVALYHEGKYTVVEEEDEDETHTQMTIAMGENGTDDFEGGKVE